MWIQAPADPIRTRPILIDERTTPRRLTLRVITGARRFTVPAAVLSITHQLGEALVPVVMGIAIDRAVRTGDATQLALWIAVLAADFAVLSFSYRFGSRIGELGMLAVQHQLRELVGEHLLTRPAARGVTAAPGVALSLATSDVNRLAWTVAIGVYPIGELAAVLFGGAVLLAISWPLGLAVLLGAPLLLWLTDRAGAPLRRRSVDEQAAAADAAGEAADLMTGYRVLKGIRAEAAAAARYRAASHEALVRTLRSRQAEGVFTGAMSLATGLFLTAIAVAAGLLAFHGELGLGELVTVIGLTQFLLAPLQGFARSTGAIWAAGTASASRLLDLLREQTVAEEGATRDAVARTADELELDAAELVIVSADGMAAREFLSQLRRRRPDALVVPHEAHLFAGTVRDNVALPGVPWERAASALADAHCEDFSSILPDGWDSPVGEGGAALSGGQRQRVALARALAQDAQLLVLHEPTTAVDAVTEASIAQRLHRARRGRRTVVVTRSPALLGVADRVLTIEPGTADESGAEPGGGGS